MAFNKRQDVGARADDPIQLYDLLPHKKDAPANLWVHQGDVIRSWHQDHTQTPDVALELPTGAGKTIVGGLIAEFRRQAGERVAYLCPTKQLASQTYDLLQQYGIPSVQLTGRSASWNPADRARYSSGKSVAVTTYAHVFNSNPAIDDAGLLILDDAHAAESYVASPWRIDIHRSESMYGDILAVLKPALDPIVHSRLSTEQVEGQYLDSVYIASLIGVAQVAGDLEAVIRSAVASKTATDDTKFSYRRMDGHLNRCLVYASYNSIEIRPFIPPTSTLAAFHSPSQRLYLSATLGAGGEIERVFGRRKIERIPVPSGWDKRGTGRRFFCFPELTTDLAADQLGVEAWTRSTVERFGRAVVLTPDKRTATRAIESYVPPNTVTLTATQVESSIDPFVGAKQAALILTNRYDGIDLADDKCRLVVLDGLPAKGDLQERFLYASLGAGEVMRERIRARIVQGAGRATRNLSDYAAVVVLGTPLMNFCTKQETQRAMRPELQAELEFGLEHSLDMTSAGMTENLDIFLAHADEWEQVDADIRARRQSFSRVDAPGTGDLAASGRHEVAAWEAAWQGSYDKAAAHARSAIDALSRSRETQRYAAFWNYLAASWSLQSGQTNRDAARRYYRSALAAGRGTTWLSHLASPADSSISAPSAGEVDALDRIVGERILKIAGARWPGTKFDDEVSTHRQGLLGTDAGPYEAALVFLGTLLGASESVGDSGATAAPDATWKFDDQLWVCWEAKSEGKPTGELGVDRVRQASGHLRYAANGGSPPAPSFTVVASPFSRVHPTCRVVGDDNIYLTGLVEPLDLLDRAVRAWRAVRAVHGGGTLEAVLDILDDQEVRPGQWSSQLMTRRLAAPE